MHRGFFETYGDSFKSRRTIRLPVDGETKLHRQDGGQVEVSVQDFSNWGFKAECREPIEIGSYVMIAVPGVGQVQAQVRWQIGGRMGAMFTTPLSADSRAWDSESLG